MSSPHDYLYRRSRARNLAPWQPVQQGVVVGPSPPENLALPTLQPTRAPGPRRAASDAYFFEQRSPLIPAPEALPGGSPLMPDRAPGAARTAPTAYAINTRELAEERIPELGNGYSDLDPRPKRRAATDAYWIKNDIATIELPPPGPLPISRPQDQRRRASSTAYWLGYDQPLATDEIPVQPSLSQSQQLFNPRRASEHSFWLPNGVPAEAAPDLPAGGVLMPPWTDAPPRADATAYHAGGGSTDLVNEGGPGPGCPVRIRRRDEEDSYFRRGDETATRPRRVDEGTSAPRRNDECQ